MIFLGILVIAIGTWLTYACRKDLVPAWKSRHWPTAAGNICGSVVHEGVGAGVTNDGTCAPTEQAFRVTDWIFSYRVAGQWYKSSRYSFSAGGWQENDRYLEEGAEVKVHYCPSDPSIAVLRPGLNPALLTGPTILALGLAFLAFALCVS